MDRRPKTRPYSADSQNRAGSLLGLLVLLPYLLVPLIYPLHLAGLSSPGAYEQNETRFLALSHHPDTPTAPLKHDNACPICKAASSFQDYSCSLPLPWPGDSAQFHPIFSGDPVKDLPAFLLSASASRAPPRSL